MSGYESGLSVTPIPGRFTVTGAMQQAHERLLSVFDQENPPEVINLQKLVDSPTSEMIVALDGELPTNYDDWLEIPEERYIGTLSLLFLRTMTRDLAQIEHVAVVPSRQGKGIGTALVKNAIKQAKAQGVSRVDLTSNQSKLAAQRVYEKTGFHTRETVNWRLEI
ncbi:MAG TPA: GNAT family N-acetyltransferase [Candidatus Saccharimonadales bacterium]|nr:GNAT family N-acetyltransferase [Candidatus Saccharimonadales bacterium]